MNADHTLDVSAIREAAEKATPGPWHPVGGSYEDNAYLKSAKGSEIALVVALLDALDAARVEAERLRIGLGGAAHGNADRMRKSLLAERDAIAEKIAVAIEAACPGCEMAVECDYQIAARIAREVGKA